MTTILPATAASPAHFGAAPPAVEAIGLTKEYPSGRRRRWRRREGDPPAAVAAVSNLDLRVEQGEIFGLLGPNGAGKSTTIRMLSTLLLPTSGQIRICGRDAVADAAAVRRLLGVVLGGERSVYWKLTARQNLEYFAAVYHVPRSETAARIAEVLNEVELSDRADEYVERYSTGMRQRLVLARALLARPRVVLLDEPTAGLDPQSAVHLRALVRELRAAGTSVLITTHYMEEADQFCDRVAIIDHGRVEACGTPADLKRTVAADVVVNMRLALAEAGVSRLLECLTPVAEVTSSEYRDGCLTLSVHAADDRDLVRRLLDAAGQGDAVVVHLDVVPVSLEDAFLSLTGRALRD